MKLCGVHHPVSDKITTHNYDSSSIPGIENAIIQIPSIGYKVQDSQKSRSFDDGSETYNNISGVINGVGPIALPELPTLKGLRTENPIMSLVLTLDMNRPLVLALFLNKFFNNRSFKFSKKSNSTTRWFLDHDK